jgi:hypothetical protein
VPVKSEGLGAGRRPLGRQHGPLLFAGRREGKTLSPPRRIGGRGNKTSLIYTKPGACRLAPQSNMRTRQPVNMQTPRHVWRDAALSRCQSCGLERDQTRSRSVSGLSLLAKAAQ